METVQQGDPNLTSAMFLNLSASEMKWIRICKPPFLGYWYRKIKASREDIFIWNQNK